jgi:hypothetical protein
VGQFGPRAYGLTRPESMTRDDSDSRPRRIVRPEVPRLLYSVESTVYLPMADSVAQTSTMPTSVLRTTVPELEAEVSSGVMEELLSMASHYGFEGWHRARVEVQFSESKHGGQ